jgi:hypothetical protein
VQFFSVSPSGNLTATNTTIGPIPSEWSDDVTGSSNCPNPAPVLNDNGDSAITITAPTTAGTYDFVVTYKVATSGGIEPSDVTGSIPAVTFRITVVSDTTAPIITPSVVGTLGNNSWYTSDVTVSWSVVDNESAISSSSGCGPTTINTDTAGTTLTCSATSAGGTSSQSVTIMRDATAPTVTLTPARPADFNGWYNAPIGFTVGGTDAMSDIASCDAGFTYSGPDSASASASGSCTDNAGNSGSGSYTFKYDATGPSASLSVTAGTAGTNGWYTSDVTISTTGSDSVSGVTCTADQFQSSESTGAIFNGSCTNGAGLTTNATALTVKLDKTGPSASLAVTAGTLGNNGWYVSDVTIGTSGSDNISSPVNCSADQFQISDTTGAAFNGSCTNDAGLTTSAASLTVKLDKTAPSITITTPANGSSFLLNQAVAANYSCADLTSSIATCAGPVASGSNIDTASTGPKNFTVNASDQAGNTNSATNSYSVAFKLCVLYDQTKSHKSGSTVPLKLQLCDFNGVNYSSAAITVRAISVTKLDSSASGILDDSGAANSPDMNFRYDATLGGSGGYIFNLSTKGLTTGTWKVTFTINGASDSTYFVKFDVK